MRSFFSNKKLIVLLVSIIILMALIGFTMRDERNLSEPEQIMRDAVGWVQNLVSAPAHFFGGIYENVQEIIHVYEENQLLRTRLEEYTQLSVQKDLLEEENERLRGMLEIDETLSDYSRLSAVIINRSPDAWEQYVGINRGQTDDVTNDMAVIDSQGGLIGKVSDSSKFTSYVQLLSDNDPTNRVSAQVMTEDEEQDPAIGFIEGYDVSDDLLIMRKVDIELEINEGETVTTSGLGDVYPSGLLIGEVSHVEVDEYGLSQNIFIEPTADFSALDYVFVVQRHLPSMDSDVTEEGENE
ncbi:rod shape-determining protein MreC [Alkalihalobacillus xiaoxiensis]|uniref:Cell shape-determining protein MreC n=1 Tax=Shouchella xiaoxiensis TaxID=766895 RepID=A0ABS2SST0_9BACI|nr:rod shape-determining protein MreC [Shouchella xiaoxiensis]MBM7838578.1 rod shape-determining protein MreC [Shouchella xiaoxiensis]